MVTEGNENKIVKTPAHSEDTAFLRLDSIHWDFANAKTGYLTHRLHPYPAKFIPQIPSALIQELSSVGETVGDIFCGSGTTLLEALRLKRNAVGIDANPLASLISKAKTTRLTTSDFEELAAHQKSCEELLFSVASCKDSLFFSGKQFKSKGWRPPPNVCEFWFLPHVVEELAELRCNIECLTSNASRTICLVTFAAIIVTVSKQDSDTRYVRRNKKVQPGDTVRHYLNQLKSSITAALEIREMVGDRFSCTVLNADVLDAPETEQFDLVVTSPPYPNAYSYHLYHQNRLIWLGYDPKHLKRIEIGSHRKYSAKGLNKATPDTFRLEFERIFCWLRQRMKFGRYACFVVGDSTIDGKRIDNTSLLANVASSSGFRELKRINRTIAPTRKAFNPKIGKIKTENILILQKA